jgi:hypothetical protein
MAEFDPSKPFTIAEPEPVGFDPSKPFTVEDQEEESDQTVIGSIARGAGAGIVDIGQGISELGAAGLEAANIIDEGSQEATTEFFENAKTNLGLTPERTAGKVVETIVNYGAPGIGVFSWVSKADKARKALQSGTAVKKARTWFGQSADLFGRKAPKVLTQTRAGRAGLTTAGTGIADVLVSPSTMTTLADSWDAMPEFLQTEDEGSLTGKELAAVRLRNKFRLGFEGASFNLAGEIVLPVAGAVIKGVGSSELSGMPTLARGLQTGMGYLGDKAKGFFPGGANFLKRNFTADAGAPEEIGAVVRTAEGITDSQEAAATRLLNDFDKAIKKSIRLQKLTGRGKKATQRTYNDTMDYLTGEMDADNFGAVYGTKVRSAVDAMRNKIDDLSVEFEAAVRSAPNLTSQRQVELLQQFQNNQGTYIRRLYELHLNPNKFSDVDFKTMPQYKQAKEELRKVIQTKKPGTVTELADQQADLFISEVFNRSIVNSFGLTPEAAARQAGASVAKGAKEVVGRTSLFKLASGMLTERGEYLDAAPALREMMGEVRNPRQAFLLTVDNMATTMASQKLFDSISSTSQSISVPGQVQYLDEAIAKMNAGGRPLAINGNNLTDGQTKVLTNDLNYTKLGEADMDHPFGGAYGSLSGNYVPTEIANSLTTPGRSQSFAQNALAVSLQLKGVSQMSKTVLNPLSQVRNFLSNTFVVGANGLLGRNMGIFESGQVLMANAIDSPEQFKLLKAMQDEGAIGQNIQLSEIKNLLKEQTKSGVSAMLNTGGKLLRKTPVAGTTINFMEKTYQLGDDYWKVVGALGEKARYGAALRKAGLDIEDINPAVQDALVNAKIAKRKTSIAGTDFGDMLAVDVVKQTMPVYSMVPEVIKSLRRIPVMGNFMAFPAEIIRTSGNIVNRSVREMGFKATDELVAAMGEEQAKAFARQIRGIGAERLTGYISMATVAPGAMRNAAHDVLGITEAEEDLLEQNKPYWSEGNTMMYLEKPDADLNAEAVDLSYMLPYEFMLAPARAAMEVYRNKGAVGANDAEKLGFAAMAAFKKFAEPFASEAMATERLVDVTLRDGKTQTGAEIYEPGEMWGDKLSKSINHVAGAFIPGIVEQAYTVKGGEITEGRINRAFTDTPSKSGDEYSVAEEAGTMLTGLRPMKVNIGRSLGYDGGAYSADRSSAVQIFTKVADDNDATAEDVMAAYVKANDAKRRHQSLLKNKIDTAMDAGFTRAQIYMSLKNSGVSRKEIRNIIGNRFEPIKISRNLIREVSNEVNVKKENRILQRLPVAEINEIKRSMINSEIVPTQVEEPVELFGSPVVEDAAPQVQAAPTQNFVGQVSNTFDNVTDSVVEKGGKVFDRVKAFVPSLLGDRANQEIADRARDNQ